MNAFLLQCALCTKTAQQLGEGPSKGLNIGVIFLIILPFVILTIAGFFAYRFYRK